MRAPPRPMPVPRAPRGACLPDTAGPPPGNAGASGSHPPAATPAPTGPTPVPSFVPPTPTPIPSFRAYEVVAGDTLISIARTFSTTARSIAYWNAAPSRRSTRSPTTTTPTGSRPAGSCSSSPARSSTPDAPRPDAAAGVARAGFDADPRRAGRDARSGAGAIAVSHGDRSTRKVALTFDMGDRLDRPSASSTT